MHKSEETKQVLSGVEKKVSMVWNSVSSGLLLIYRADFWVSSSPSGQFLTFHFQTDVK